MALITSDVCAVYRVPVVPPFQSLFGHEVRSVPLPLLSILSHSLALPLRHIHCPFCCQEVHCLLLGRTAPSPLSVLFFCGFDSVSGAIVYDKMSNYVAVITAVTDAVKITLLYFYTLYEYIYQGKSYTSCTTFQDDTWARVQIYSLSLIFKLWSKPHYRSPTFQQDMIDNLSNVAIPGTIVFITMDDEWYCLYSYHSVLTDTHNRLAYPSNICPMSRHYDTRNITKSLLSKPLSTSYYGQFLSEFKVLSCWWLFSFSHHITLLCISSGTGVPLSVFCHSYYSCMFFIVIINPWICFFGAFNKARIEQKKTNSLGMDVFISDVVKFYKTHLLHPDDWFSLWRLNCRLVSYHSHLTQAKGYKQEVWIKTYY